MQDRAWRTKADVGSEVANHLGGQSRYNDSHAAQPARRSRPRRGVAKQTGTSKNGGGRLCVAASPDPCTSGLRCAAGACPDGIRRHTLRRVDAAKVRVTSTRGYVRWRRRPGCRRRRWRRGGGEGGERRRAETNATAGRNISAPAPGARGWRRHPPTQGPAPLPPPLPSSASAPQGPESRPESESRPARRVSEAAPRRADGRNRSSGACLFL